MKNKKNREKNKGFTLLELMITVALIGIIYSITLSNYDGMNKAIELRNSTYLVALAIREAQIFGINKKIQSDPTEDDTFSDQDPYPFGIHIDLNNPDDQKKIIIFRDKDPINNHFDGNCISDIRECDKTIKLKKGNHISHMYLQKSNGQWEERGIANVLFKRPNPDAIITSNISTVYSRIQIETSSSSGIYKGCIEIGSAGDVSIKNECNH